MKAKQRCSYSEVHHVKKLATSELLAFGIFDSFNYPRPPNDAYAVTNSGELIPSWVCPEVAFVQPKAQD